MAVPASLVVVGGGSLCLALVGGGTEGFSFTSLHVSIIVSLRNDINRRK